MRGRGIRVVVALVLATVAGEAAAATQEAAPGAGLITWDEARLSAPVHAVLTEHNVGVPMRDGTVLSADVYRPDEPGTFPALLLRTPYSNNSPDEIERAIRESGMVTTEIRLIPSAAQLQRIPPLVVLELLWIRLTMLPAFARLRTNVIVRCMRPADRPTG